MVKPGRNVPVVRCRMWTTMKSASRIENHRMVRAAIVAICVSRERCVRRCRPQLGLFVGILLMDGQLALVHRALAGVLRVGDLALQQREAIGDRGRAVGEVRALLQRSRSVETAAGRVMADDGDVRAEDLVAERVVIVVVRVHDVFHRLARQRLHIGDEGRRGGSGDARIDQQHVFVVHDDHGVAADGHRSCGGGVVDPLGYLLESMRRQRARLGRHRRGAAPALRLCEHGVGENEQGERGKKESSHEVLTVRLRPDSA
jgi:hypothetical protein